MVEVHIPVSCGELIDKITILEIKLDKIQDANKQANIGRELQALDRVMELRLGAGFARVAALKDLLKAVNSRLWTIEDDLRDCERHGSFDDRFITLARAVYKTNDERAAIKRQIDEALGSVFREEKSYSPYL